MEQERFAGSNCRCFTSLINKNKLGNPTRNKNVVSKHLRVDGTGHLTESNTGLIYSSDKAKLEAKVCKQTVMLA